MDKEMKKALYKLARQEDDFFGKESKTSKLKDKIYEKVPEGLQHTLEVAFQKAFSILFLKGSGIIGKTFNRDEINKEFQLGDYWIEEEGSRESLRILDKGKHKRSLVNNVTTTASGFGMGLIGMGIPDIPLLIATILRGLYEICEKYGYDFEAEEEKKYLLRIIGAALAEGDQQLQLNEKLDKMNYTEETLDDEIALTSKILSDALLIEKFVQGLPIVGVIGGFVNNSVYRKITFLAQIKYKKRYLLGKVFDDGPNDAA